MRNHRRSVSPNLRISYVTFDKGRIKNFSQTKRRIIATPNLFVRHWAFDRLYYTSRTVQAIVIWNKNCKIATYRNTVFCGITYTNYYSNIVIWLPLRQNCVWYFICAHKIYVAYRSKSTHPPSPFGPDQISPKVCIKKLWVLFRVPIKKLEQKIRIEPRSARNKLSEPHLRSRRRTKWRLTARKREKKGTRKGWGTNLPQMRMYR